MKDGLDSLTHEIPFPQRPMQGLVDVLRRSERTPGEVSVFVQKVARQGAENGRSGNADRGPGLEAGADAGVFYPCEKQGVRYTVVDPSAMTPAIEKKPVRR